MTFIDTKKCLVCESVFKFKNKRQIYCSNNCNAAAYRARNPQKVKESRHKSYVKDKSQYRERCKRWYHENKEHMKQYRKTRSEINRRYWKDRRSVDVIFRIKNNMRNRVNSLLKGNIKESSIIDYIGLSIEDLKKHLESQFQPGMTWDNYGKGGWHIDHIVPCSKFDFSKEEDLKKCWHYSNLQPLWEEDNLRKWCKDDIYRH